jgi:hypothetical protein
MSDPNYRNTMLQNWKQITKELLELDYSLKSELVSIMAKTTKKKVENDPTDIA